MKTTLHILWLLIIFVTGISVAQNVNEVLLSSTENAYDPVPSPDGKLIAYVRTGWGNGVWVGFGRASLRTELAVMTLSGDVLSQKPLANAFLYGWTSDSNNLIGYRDGRALLVAPYGGISRQADETGISEQYVRSERAAYLSKTDTFVWVEHRHEGTVLFTQLGELSKVSAATGSIVVPSPNERYIAVAGNAVGGSGTRLWVYDTVAKTWADLGMANIHPNDDWDYIKPSWNPWFADSSRLAFFSGSRLVLVSPDGKQKKEIANVPEPCGLAVASPDGKHIAYVTFQPRPMKIRKDLSFWGGTAIWVVGVSGKDQPQRITTANEDTTYVLNWMGDDRLVFDRIADQPFYGKARLWTVALR